MAPARFGLAWRCGPCLRHATRGCACFCVCQQCSRVACIGLDVHYDTAPMPSSWRLSHVCTRTHTLHK
eukprot:4190591-Alexandrium_andersonii.AAC.1